MNKATTWRNITLALMAGVFACWLVSEKLNYDYYGVVKSLKWLFIALSLVSFGITIRYLFKKS